MPLTDVLIRNTKSADRPLKLFDGDGLFLLIKPNGSRGWRFKYRFEGRERLLSFGTYPEVPLKTARERREQARSLIAAGIDPSAERKAKIAAREDRFGIFPRRSVPTCAFIPKCHSLPLRTWCISGSRAPSAFLVEVGASIIVASTIVPDFSKSRLSSNSGRI